LLAISCAGQRQLAHLLRLPGFAVIAILLAMADRAQKWTPSTALTVSRVISKSKFTTPRR
jgi:hypothetical protein